MAMPGWMVVLVLGWLVRVLGLVWARARTRELELVLELELVPLPLSLPLAVLLSDAAAQTHQLQHIAL